MILTGTLPNPEPLKVRITADTTDFVRYIVETARNVTTLDVMLEVIGLTPGRVWSRFYVRGAWSLDFNDEDTRDSYLRVLLNLKGDRGRAALEGFLQGWADHRGTEAVEPFVWHRLIGDTAVSVRAVS